MKKTILITALFCAIKILAQENKEITTQTDEFLSNLSKLSPQELIDKSLYHYTKNSFDTVLIYCNLIINTIPKNADIEQQTLLLTAYNRSANIHTNFANYRLAFDIFIKSLIIAEKYDLSDELPSIYHNIGFIYGSLKNPEMAKKYYLKALCLDRDSAKMISTLNNLAVFYIKTGKKDSAYYYLNKAISLSKKNEDTNMLYMLNNLAEYYKIEKQYDSAFYYFRQSIGFSKINNDIRAETTNLSDIGKLFFEINKIDSALYYIDLSNKIAYENKFLQIITENYLILSEIEKSKGRYKSALELYETYTNLKDSITNAGVYGSINLLQTQYENSKTNQQIEELIIDRQIKENTIHYQKIIMNIVIIVSALMGLVLIIIIVQNKRLKKTYKVLVDKNVEIMGLLEIRQDEIPPYQNIEVNFENTTDPIPETTETENEITALETSELETHEPEVIPSEIESSSDTLTNLNNEKYKKIVLSEKAQKELLNKILDFMKNTSEICDPEFTMDKLAVLIRSNHLYVSFVINYILKMNFNSFLNIYRIREAQRQFLNPNNSKYSIEHIANQVGYKSRKTFNKAFKEITGVTPAFYIKSLKEEGEEEGMKNEEGIVNSE